MSTPHLAQVLSTPTFPGVFLPLFSILVLRITPLTRLGSANFPFFSRDLKKPDISLKNGAFAGAISCEGIGVWEVGEPHEAAGAATDLAVEDLRKALIFLGIEKL